MKVLKQIEVDEKVDNDLSEMKARMNRLKAVTRTTDVLNFSNKNPHSFPL